MIKYTIIISSVILRDRKIQNLTPDVIQWIKKKKNENPIWHDDKDINNISNNISINNNINNSLTKENMNINDNTINSDKAK